jgi:uncharacterized delta-60 repeat protein
MKNVLTLTPYFGCAGFTAMCHLSISAFVKRRTLSALIAMTLLAFCGGCSKKDDPVPDPSEKPEEKPGTVTEEDISYDKSFSIHLGKAKVAAMHSDGKVIISGISNNTTATLFRVDKDGKHDASFNIDLDKSWVIKKIQVLAMQSDGRVIVGGQFVLSGKTYNIIRLTASGALDKSFTAQQDNQTSSIDEAGISALTVQKNDKIVFNATALSNGYLHNYLGRLNADGSTDIDFQFVLPTLPPELRGGNLYQIMALPDNKLLVCGSIVIKSRDNKTSRRDIMRLNADGSLDPAFNFQEKLLGVFTCLTTQSDGKILAGGQFTGQVDESQRDTQYNYANILRLNTNGAIDQSFTVVKNQVLPVEIVTRADNSFVALSGLYPVKSHVSTFSSNGGFKIGYSIADDTSVMKRLFKQSENQFLVAGEMKSNGKDFALARLNIK